MVGNGRTVPDRRQGIHIVRSRHDHGRRCGDAGLADRAAGDAGTARPSRREGPRADPVHAPPPPRPHRVTRVVGRARPCASRARRSRRSSQCVVLLAIASPALHLKIHNTGVNDLPPNLPGIDGAAPPRAGLPQRRVSGRSWSSRPTTPPPRSHPGDREAAQRGAGRRRCSPAGHRSTTNKSHTVTTVALPLAGNGSNHVVQAGPRPLCGIELIPPDHRPGRRRSGQRHR